MFHLHRASEGLEGQAQPHQLPPGRHGLPRSFVVSNQRERILSAVAYLTSAASYSEMSVEDIIVTAVEAADTFADQCAAGLRSFLGFVASEPAFARMCIVEVPAAGPEAIKRRNDAMQAFAAMIDGKANELLEGKIPPPLTAETVVGRRCCRTWRTPRSFPTWARKRPRTCGRGCRRRWPPRAQAGAPPNPISLPSASR